MAAEVFAATGFLYLTVAPGPTKEERVAHCTLDLAAQRALYTYSRACELVFHSQWRGVRQDRT